MPKIDLMQIDANGMLSIRYKKRNGEYHRTVIPFETDPDAQLDAVDTHFLAMGEVRMRASARALLKSAAVIAKAQKDQPDE